VVNVGDSPVYLVRGETIDVISTPHTMMHEYKEMAPEAARKVGDHLRHVLTRAMGLNERVQPDAREAELFGGEVVVICSDGLSDKVSPEEILEVVSYERPERAGKTLVNMANERGGDDNITVVIIRWGNQVAPGETYRTGQGKRIAVDYDTEEATHRTTISGIRPDGVFLGTREAIAVGEQLYLTFTPEQGGEAITINGRVVSRGPEGIDVRFENVTPVQQKWIAAHSGK
jgi:hypothetical protein